MAGSRTAALAMAADDELTLDKVYCANCTHCKLIRISAGNGSKYYLRVR